MDDLKLRTRRKGILGFLTLWAQPTSLMEFRLATSKNQNKKGIGEIDTCEGKPWASLPIQRLNPSFLKPPLMEENWTSKLSKVTENLENENPVNPSISTRGEKVKTKRNNGTNLSKIRAQINE